ncbi:hypothetical protein RRX38_06325 [Pseudomonas sp. DTU_2021_1001937_2_SI_NGA_ILE_001]|nr:hypothetical protein RRX38_06325 [Pseudomonas sp. DTU_2021_1001937_2_SI_NGA_ILE_001]
MRKNGGQRKCILCVYLNKTQKIQLNARFFLAFKRLASEFKVVRLSLSSSTLSFLRMGDERFSGWVVGSGIRRIPARGARRKTGGQAQGQLSISVIQIADNPS